jgi:hypothetical protein
MGDGDDSGSQGNALGLGEPGKESLLLGPILTWPCAATNEVQNTNL